jgi:hypothetical protein
MTITIATHRYKPMTAEMRPQRSGVGRLGAHLRDARAWRGYQDAMPQAIRVTDAEGRWCIYEPTMIEGHVVQSYGHNLSQEEERPISRGPWRSPSRPAARSAARRRS